ncbi:Pls/PosA family non-ribosomal peptide synthetase [Kutzneria buriramensis]|uniref:Non-ribosomal peptide synthetase-like protein n=1 Tax=Kutzneria buriramensis TaxID=1045776 RepID=A0A3E0H7T2_9PSEU|nr:Pls/PosA family non-ribosomal peptide synthetase [Kutzneria buriramensis]REH39499.1 non-ribosomal peptide synthetase-like protein [Kutzneria buriramensis]
MSDKPSGADQLLVDPDISSAAVYAARPAAPPRTLLDILDATAAACPDATALDDGTTLLSYGELCTRAGVVRDRLRAAGIGVGDRVGVRISSGTAELYLAILGVLGAGAAYVPVDVDDPPERAALVWTEADVTGVLTDGGALALRRPPVGRVETPGPEDDAWIIFTSGSTGTPKGVAVTHRNAAAFADAEARLFLPRDAIGPGDRVLAGLSVAFDASCEEMWLAWRNGACLVPAPRSLVKSGADLGEWLRRNWISAVSTVPTLAAMWPVEELGGVRLLIFGGEACPPDLAARFASGSREVWNTYGPTEATVVACAARLEAGEPVRIGLPLDGWQLAVVGVNGEPVEWGGTGELVIGGVGLARYLDVERDAQRFAPMPGLGWDRAYRTGDVVRAEREGLVFVGRDDDQVKIGGRRVELGEIDMALASVPGVAVAACAVQRTSTGSPVLVGYVVLEDGVGGVDRTLLARQLPPALVPRIVVLDDLPTRTSGKVDRKALPWPVDVVEQPLLEGAAGWVAEQWRQVLGIAVGEEDDFFGSGGASLAAAHLVSLLRKRCPRLSMTDIYQFPTVGEMAARIDELSATETSVRAVTPVPRAAGFVQALILLVLQTFAGLRWLVVLATLNDVVTALFGPQKWAPQLAWPIVACGWLMLVLLPGRVLTAVGLVRLLTLGIAPGRYPRGGGVHLRLWTADRVAAMNGIAAVSGTHWSARVARLLGCEVGRNVLLHSLPPLTGLGVFGDGAAIEPEADIAGVWVDGDEVEVGRIVIGAGARVGTRSTLLPGAVVETGFEVIAGTSTIVPAGDEWPAARVVSGGRLKYTAALLGLGLLPIVALVPGVVVTGLFVHGDGSLNQVLWNALEGVVPATLLTVTCYVGLHAALIRLCALGLREGTHPADGWRAWCAWLTAQLMATARGSLFPLYASLITPHWLRLSGARVGRRVEASTVLTLPRLLTVGDASFLADDALLAPYELRGGWMRLGRSSVGERAFVGNSGIVAGGSEVAESALVGVLATAPRETAPGSSWLGRPAIRLPRNAQAGDPSRTYRPPRRLVLARALVESCRLLPVLIAATLLELVMVLLEDLDVLDGVWWTCAVAGIVLLGAGLVACVLTTVSKWLLVGRFRRGQHPLWCSFVWRNELYDCFVEELAVPWLMRMCYGTPMLNVWLRSLGARIGHGVWCETHWLPETDLVGIEPGATVNRGTVVQTHLFHDRLMQLDEVRVGAGATIGPHSVVLPGSRTGDGVTLGPASLVMRGEEIPAGTRWRGNPVSAW